jgi:hypothetical protein
MGFSSVLYSDKMNNKVNVGRRLRKVLLKTACQNRDVFPFPEGDLDLFPERGFNDHSYWKWWMKQYRELF